MDKRVVEMIARNYLVNQLVRCGVEVALPLRDIGIDLVAYVDRDCPGDHFIARPIQLKANYKEGFSIDGKYEGITSLLIVFAWHLQSEEQTEFYALSYLQSESLADKMGWAWRRDKRWVVTQPSQQLKQAIQQYRVSPDSWREILPNWPSPKAAT